MIDCSYISKTCLPESPLPRKGGSGSTTDDFSRFLADPIDQLPGSCLPHVKTVAVIAISQIRKLEKTKGFLFVCFWGVFLVLIDS